MRRSFRGMVQPHRFLKLESVSFGTTRTFSDGTLNSLDATLITAANSAAVVQRLYEYYQRRRSVSAELIITTEHPGAKISLPTGYAGNLTGHVKSVDISLSSNMRAAVEVVAE